MHYVYLSMSSDLTHATIYLEHAPRDPRSSTQIVLERLAVRDVSAGRAIYASARAVIDARSLLGVVSSEAMNHFAGDVFVWWTVPLPADASLLARLSSACMYSRNAICEALELALPVNAAAMSALRICEEALEVALSVTAAALPALSISLAASVLRAAKRVDDHLFAANDALTKALTRRGCCLCDAAGWLY